MSKISELESERDSLRDDLYSARQDAEVLRKELHQLTEEIERHRSASVAPDTSEVYTALKNKVDADLDVLKKLHPILIGLSRIGNSHIIRQLRLMLQPFRDVVGPAYCVEAEKKMV